MNERRPETTYDNPWKNLKKYTTARIALGRCGSSLPTAELLDFQLCHARARDAVHTPLDFEQVKAEVERITEEPAYLLESRVTSRGEYLRRPDLGRKLSAASAEKIRHIAKTGEYDIALVVADGLSATAIAQNVGPFFAMLIPELKKSGYSLAPVCLVKEGRVAVADDIGHIFRAKLVVNFIGERPGLKSANSMGIYMTFAPEPGTTDERRNCISNVRPEGMPYPAGVSKLLYLIGESLRKRLSGVNLKDEQVDRALER